MTFPTITKKDQKEIDRLYQGILDIERGDALKTEGQAQVSNHNPDFVRIMRAYARSYAAEHGTVTSDDLRLYANSLGLVPKHPNAWGALFQGRGWKAVGYTKSKLPSNRARMLRQWTFSPYDTEQR